MKMLNILVLAGETFFIMLFLYVLYLIGGIAHGIKELQKKMVEVEQKLETMKELQIKRRPTRRSN